MTVAYCLTLRFAPTAAFLIAAGHALAQSSFTVVPMRAYGLSGDGASVVGFTSETFGGAPDSFRRVRWSGGTGLGDLGALPGSSDPIAGFALSADGSVIVGSGSDANGVIQAVRADASGVRALGGIPGAVPRADNGLLSGANGISSDGSVVVGGSRATSDPAASSSQAFRWTSATGMQGLGYLPGAEASYATGVSADGATIVGDSEGEAFRWSNSGMIGLGNLNGGASAGGFSTAIGVSDDGGVIVGQSERGVTTEAYRWTLAGGMIGLGVLPGDVASGANAVSGDGRAVAGLSVNANNKARAFIWDDANGMQDLRATLAANGLAGDVTGWEFTEVNGLARNADGTLTVLVNGFNPNVGARAVVARFTPVPEPATLATLGFGALALLRRRRV